LVQVNPDYILFECRILDVRQELRRVGFELLQKHSGRRDLAEHMAIGSTRDRQRDRQ
jgi:hypothetical protein